MYNSSHSLNLPEVGALFRGGEKLCIFPKVVEMPANGLLISALSVWLLPAPDCICPVFDLEMSVTGDYLTSEW